MDVFVALAGPLCALLGVWLGTRMSTRGQAQAWRQEQLRQASETRRIAFVKHLAAVRAYITYVTAHGDDMSVASHPDGTGLRPLFTGGGHAFREALETTYSELQLVAVRQETVNKAHHLSRAARRIAVAAAQKDARMQARLLVFWDLERELVNELRQELGQELRLVSPYDADAVLP